MKKINVNVTAFLCDRTGDGSTSAESGGIPQRGGFHGAGDPDAEGECLRKAGRDGGRRGIFSVRLCRWRDAFVPLCLGGTGVMDRGSGTEVSSIRKDFLLDR